CCYQFYITIKKNFSPHYDPRLPAKVTTKSVQGCGNGHKTRICYVLSPYSTSFTRVCSTGNTSSLNHGFLAFQMKFLGDGCGKGRTSGRYFSKFRTFPVRLSFVAADR